MNISIIGSGNVASVLAESLVRAHHTINYICSRNRKTGSKLATTVKATFLAHTSKLPDTSDLNIIATDDSSIEEVINQLNIFTNAVVHTSGATSMSVLNRFRNHGVLYPVNSITSRQGVIATGTFFCIEASNGKLLSTLRKISIETGGKPVRLDSHQRLSVHISAVFANNFVNALYQTSHDILNDNKISPEIIKPLLETTLDRALNNNSPHSVQTGPAVRNDQPTIKKHLQFLKSKPELRNIYKHLTELIIKQSNRK
jgi:predicted short-subunit dehydrogenase-like oxidoreductase (DUF2520 family)